MPEEIPAREFVYRLVVDGHVVARHLLFHGPLRVGDTFPLAEGGGLVTEIRWDAEEASYELHVTPIV